MSEILVPMLDRTAMTPAMTVIIGVASVILRSMALLCLGACVARFWPRASAAQRHLVWTVTCAVAILTPVLQLAVPAWNVVVASVVETPVGLGARGLIALPAALAAKLVLKGAAAPLVTQDPTIASEIFVAIAVCALWGAGAIVTIAVFVRTHLRARALVDETVECDTPHVLRVAHNAAAMFDLPSQFSMRYHATAMPFVYGIRQSIVVLPVSAAQWTTDRLRAVLYHEFAHIARRDIVAQLVASVTCALYWFNPLAWVAARALRTEREIACDDQVLTAGARPSRYASHLLDLAGTFEAPSEASVAALAFARPAQIHTRLQSIIDPVRRRTGVTRGSVMVVAALMAGAAYPLLALTPVLGRVQVPVLGRVRVREIAENEEFNARHPNTVSLLYPLLQDTLMKRHAAAAIGAALLSSASAHGLHAQNPGSRDASSPMILVTPGFSVSSDTSTVSDDSEVVSGIMSAVVDTIKYQADSAAGGINFGMLRIQGKSGTPLQTVLSGSVSAAPSPGNADPIVIVDGVRVKNKNRSPLDQIDAASIAAIQVLKGPSAVATYGADAANGVIVITTKKGAKKTSATSH